MHHKHPRVYSRLYSPCDSHSGVLLKAFRGGYLVSHGVEPSHKYAEGGSREVSQLTIMRFWQAPCCPGGRVRAGVRVRVRVWGLSWFWA